MQNESRFVGLMLPVLFESMLLERMPLQLRRLERACTHALLINYIGSAAFQTRASHTMAAKLNEHVICLNSKFLAATAATAKVSIQTGVGLAASFVATGLLYSQSVGTFVTSR